LWAQHFGKKRRVREQRSIAFDIRLGTGPTMIGAVALNLLNWFFNLVRVMNNASGLYLVPMTERE